jgi:hypothetical protein
VNRADLQQLAEDRLLDAQALLAANRWSGAYYLAGYAVECGLKSCVLAHVVRSGVIFQDRRYAEKCWTHDIEELVRLAGLEAARCVEVAANPSLGKNWLIAGGWSETSRYQQKTQTQAQELFDAVNDHANGVLQWIRKHW